MKTSFTSTIAGLPSKRTALAVFLSISTALPLLVGAFETDTPVAASHATFNSILQDGEAGDLKKEETLPAVWHLFNGEYNAAKDSVRSAPASYPDWFSTYIKGLPDVSSKLVKIESEHFILFTPPGQEFLADYALPALEKAGDYYQKIWKVRPPGKVRVEIYPTKEDFSQASTLSVATLESSGAIGICKFHRLMILTPQALPIGYRWLDALTHEYTHLMINALSGAHAELWIHEGIARYFETAPRSRPPYFLTPQQKTDLKQAQTDDKLIPFSKMSPSLVYLKDQSEVSLAFSEVSYSVSTLVSMKGEKRLGDFLRSLRSLSFSDAFVKSYGQPVDKFEKEVHKGLAQENWPVSKGALSDDVRFTPINEDEAVGADAKAEMNLGDQMRLRGRFDGAMVEYENALQEEPDNAILLLKAARTVSELGHDDEAKDYLERAVEKNPNYITPYMDLSLKVDPVRAHKLLTEALALNPFDPRIHERLASSPVVSETDRKREAEIALKLRSVTP